MCYIFIQIAVLIDSGPGKAPDPNIAQFQPIPPKTTGPSRPNYAQLGHFPDFWGIWKLAYV